MNIEKIKIKKEKFDINLKFYFTLKYLLKAALSEKDVYKIYQLSSLYQDISFKSILLKKLEEFFGNSKSGINKQKYIADILEFYESSTDNKLFMFALKLYLVKPLLLQEAKTRDLLDISKLPKLNPLSLAYDKVTLFSPYSTRVSGALLSLMFFDKLEKNDCAFFSSDTTDFLKQLSNEAIELKKVGVEANQIFMLMFSESINQSNPLNKPKKYP